MVIHDILYTNPLFQLTTQRSAAVQLNSHQGNTTGASTLVLVSLMSSALTCSPVEPEDEPALFLVEGFGPWFCCSILVLVLRLMDSVCNCKYIK